MVLKLTPKEIEWLTEYDGGPFGEKTLVSFMAEICARIDGETREVDIGCDERERIASFEADEASRVIVQRVFKRPLEKAMKDFFG